MATRAAIAAQDRAVKKSIADKDREENRRQFKKSHDLATQRANYEGLERSSNVVKNLSQAAFGKGGMAAAMSENNPEWYKKFGLSNYAVNLPTFYRLGSKLGPATKSWRSKSAYDTVPGIAVINFIPALPNNYPNPSYPNKSYQQSPINQCLTRFTAELRKLNSRVGEYDPADLGFYWYSVEGVMFDLGRLAKALKFYNTYYAENRYFAKACIASCGFDVDDFLDHVPEYKARLIKWIDIFNSNVVLPDSLDLLKRAFWISNVVIREHKTNCSQIYHFNCVVDMHLSDNEEYVALSDITGKYTYIVFTNAVESKIQALFNSVGVVIMTADLRAAFPDNRLLKFPQFTSSDTVIYSDSVHDLEQVHNLTTLPVTHTYFGDTKNGVFSSRSTLVTKKNIIQDPDGYLAQGIMSGGNMQPMIYTLGAPNMDHLRTQINSKTQPILNFYDSEYVSDDAILEGTRLRHLLNDYVESAGGRSFAINGTEIVTDIVLVLADVTSDGYTFMYVYTDVDGESNINIPVQVASAIADITTFDWFPIITYYAVDDDEFLYTFGEIDHAIALLDDNLRIIHEGCAFSLFYVSDFGRGRVA